MINTMKKSLVLAAAIAAMTAIAVPSMASAANWGPLNTYHTLTSPSSITFTVTNGGSSAGISCSSGPRFTAQVRTPASTLMDLTSTSTLSCTGTGATFAGCNIALGLNGLPLWSANGTNPSNVAINSVNIEATFTGGSCPVNGATSIVTGTLAGGVWSNLTRSLAFTSGTGLTFTWTSVVVGGPFPVTVTASEFIKDTTSPFVGLF
jgi:hypothetical protein